MGKRPKTDLTRSRQNLRCPKCGRAVNRQLKRCKGCAKVLPKN